jgi:hypothetical protein
LFGAPAQGVAAIVRTTAEYHPKNRNKKKEERRILTPIDKTGEVCATERSRQRSNRARAETARPIEKRQQPRNIDIDINIELLGTIIPPPGKEYIRNRNYVFDESAKTISKLKTWLKSNIRRSRRVIRLCLSVINM